MNSKTRKIENEYGGALSEMGGGEVFARTLLYYVLNYYPGASWDELHSMENLRLTAFVSLCVDGIQGSNPLVVELTKSTGVSLGITLSGKCMNC